MDTAEVQALYEQQGYLSALPILSPEELQNARRAFAELERKHGEYDWTITKAEILICPYSRCPLITEALFCRGRLHRVQSS